MRDDQERRRPAPHRPPDPETVWLDIDTARGVDAAGNEILPVLGGRRTKRATLSDLLTTALHHNARRLIVCGDIPDRPQSWLCLLYTSPSPRDQRGSRMPSSA